MAKKTKSLDLKRYPGFRPVTWFCLIFLYAPILVM